MSKQVWFTWLPGLPGQPLGVPRFLLRWDVTVVPGQRIKMDASLAEEIFRCHPTECVVEPLESVGKKKKEG